MYLQTAYSKEKAIRILSEQVDKIPNFFALNILQFKSTSSVCGFLRNNYFELRNRTSPFFSMRAKGEFVDNKGGTIIKITWLRSKYPSVLNLFLRRYDIDKKIILAFLTNWLKVKIIEKD